MIRFILADFGGGEGRFDERLYRLIVYVVVNEKVVTVGVFWYQYYITLFFCCSICRVAIFQISGVLNSILLVLVVFYLILLQTWRLSYSFTCVVIGEKCFKYQYYVG